MNTQTVYARPVAQAAVEERLGFLQRVYGWMLGALALCAVGAAASIEYNLTARLLQTGIMGWILITVAWIGLAHVVQKVRHQPVVNILAFAAYALFTGFVVSGLVYVALLMGSMHGDSSQYVVQAFGLTALTFGGLTVYAFFSKRDFSFLRGMLTIGAFAILGLLILEFFIQSSILALGTSFLAVLVFGGFTLYDTQKIIRTYPSNEHVAGAVTLFTNFVLLFMHILRILLLLAGGRD